MARRSRQLDLPMPPTWGGCRRGAGRRPVSARPGRMHAPRPEHDTRCPVHVTLRCNPSVPSLRSTRLFPWVRAAISASSHRGFRAVHFSVQADHVHLIVEADCRQSLTSGIQGLAIRCALAVNRCVGRRGKVWSGRYHARALRTPGEVRRGLVYVLLNFRKHLRAAPFIDPCSSGPWFEGWSRPTAAPIDARPVATPRTWLLAVGWRRAGGLVDWRESPAAPSRARRRT